MDIKLTPLCDTIQFLDISDEEYFSSKYADYISNSRLSLINPEQGGSTNGYIAGFSGSKTSDSLLLGSAVHALILQPESFELIESVNRPTAKLGFMADELYSNYCKGDLSDECIINASDKLDYYRGKMDVNKINNVREKCSEYWAARSNWELNYATPDMTPIYLDPATRVKLNRCVDSVRRNRVIQKLFNPDYIVQKPLIVNEGTLIMDVKATFEDGSELILPLKAKLDNFIIDFENKTITLNDLKTTGHYLRSFGESFEKYHYYRQMAMYFWMLAIYCKEYHGFTPNRYLANMVVVSTVPQFQSGVFAVTRKQQQHGMQEFSKLIRIVADTMMNVHGLDGNAQL